MVAKMHTTATNDMILIFLIAEREFCLAVNISFPFSWKMSGPYAFVAVDSVV